MKPHQKLDAWKFSFQNVVDIYALTKNFPVDERFGLISQMRRASVSVSLNIAEGAARKTSKEFIQFLHYSLGSLSELDTCILLCKALSYISEEQEKIFIEKLDIIGKLIYGLIKHLEKETGTK